MSCTGGPLPGVDSVIALGVGFYYKLGERVGARAQVDHPLCLECATRVREEVDELVAEVDEECAAYEAAIAQLEREDLQLLPEAVCPRSTICVLWLSPKFPAHCAPALVSQLFFASAVCVEGLRTVFWP